jgi:hypothetical protein
VTRASAWCLCGEPNAAPEVLGTPDVDDGDARGGVDELSPNDPRGTSTRRSSAIFLSSLCTSSALSPAVDTPRSASAARRSATFIFAGDADAIAGEPSGGGAPRSGVIPSSVARAEILPGETVAKISSDFPLSSISDLPARNLGREGSAFTVSENGPPPNAKKSGAQKARLFAISPPPTRAH